MFRKIQRIFLVFKEAGKLLAANDPLRMAGATAFFATFALPPMLMIIVRTFGVFFGRRRVGGQILSKVENVLGSEGGEQIRAVIRGVRSFQSHPAATALIFVFLLFVATTLFMVIKDSINQLWRIRVNKKRHFVSVMLSRVKAMGFILFTGVLFLAVMAVELLQAYFGPRISEVWPQLGSYMYSLLNHVVSLSVVTAWFLVLFRFLPDGRPPIRTNLAGAVMTGLLFSAGKYVLRWVLSGNIKSIYGTSGALVLILLFVFYSALILYYGAAFTRVWGSHFGAGVKPLPHAASYRVTQSDITSEASALN